MLDITTLAAWGEFIGGIAVVVSLVYLAGQIKQNSRLVLASTSIATSQMQESVAGYMVEDPDVARIYYAGLTGRDALPEVDRQRFDGLLSIQLQGLIARRDFAREGMTSPGSEVPIESALRWLFTQPGPQEFWRTWTGMYPPEFTDYVDGLIREGAAAE
jgi:hypothetical protein